MTEQYRVVTRYTGHPTFGDWESATRSPMTYEQAEKFVAAKKAAYAVKDTSLLGEVLSMGIEPVGMLKGLRFDDGGNMLTADYWPGTDEYAPTVDICVQGYEYDLSLDEAEKLYDFLGSALERGEEWTRGA